MAENYQPQRRKEVVGERQKRRRLQAAVNCMVNAAHNESNMQATTPNQQNLTDTSPRETSCNLGTDGLNRNINVVCEQSLAESDINAGDDDEEEEDNAGVGAIEHEFDWSNLRPIDSEQPEQSFEDRVTSTLQDWAVTRNVSRSTVTDLLKRLNKEAHLAFLPLDARTLLKTRKKRLSILKPIPPGFYYHFGVSEPLQDMLIHKKDRPQVLDLLINIDGLPLSKSNGNCFWPIQGKILNYPDVGPYIIGVYFGPSKPQDVNLFLEDFVNDVLLEEQRLEDAQDEWYKFKIAAFVCDSPAKSMITAVKSHNGYHGCHKCIVRGEYAGNPGILGGRVVFLRTDEEERSNDMFRNNSYKHHYNELLPKSVLLKLKIDMIKSFLLDYMHVSCLGVMKKLLTLWKSNYLTTNELADISRILEEIKKFIPREFARKTRGLNHLKHFKATEFRLQLLYVAAFVFKNVLDEDLYNHYLYFHVAMRLLVDEMKCHNYTDYCKDLLKWFVKKSVENYGKKFVSHNVHSLIHLADDVKTFGSLDRYSAFPFENNLQQVKNLIRKNGRQLQQLANRLGEIEENARRFRRQIVERPQSNRFELSESHRNGPLPCSVITENVKQFKKLRNKNVFFSLNVSDCFVMFRDLSIAKVCNFYRCNISGETFIVGNIFRSKQNFYTEPLPSSAVNEFVVSELPHSVESWNVNAILHKMLTIPLNGRYYFASAIIHRIDE